MIYLWQRKKKNKKLETSKFDFHASLQELIERYRADIIWKDVYIDGVKTNYICSNYGDIATTRSRHGHKEIVQLKNNNGYTVVYLSINNHANIYLVHRLVASAFIPIPKELLDQGYTEKTLQVNHIDRDKNNNSIYNLEWVTRQENVDHYMESIREDTGEEEYTLEQIKSVCHYLSTTNLIPHEISSLTEVSVNAIKSILNQDAYTNISYLYDFSNYAPYKFKGLKYSDEQIGLMLKLLLEKRECDYISMMTGIPIKSVYWYRNRHKKLLNYRGESKTKITQEQVNLIIRYYKDGYSWIQIGDMVGASMHAVYRIKRRIEDGLIKID